uniref:Equatorin n=1 Tax=Caenorhabditis tropicalis TaxID=1561998 RepID=A0A1I7USV2_9PELO
MLLLLFTAVLSAISVVIPECQPPADCSVHVFRVRLSQKPDVDDPENTTYSAFRNNEYGNNYYEIRGGKEMTPKLAAEIIQSMGKDADPRLKEKITNKEFYWKPVGPGGDHSASPSLPPPPQPKKEEASTASPSDFKPTDFPFLLVTLLLCVGIFMGILLTAFCIFMASMQKEPQFDRSSVIIYNKVGGASESRRPMLPRRREQQIELIERASVAPSLSSGTRIGPAWRNGNGAAPSTASRHISL